MRFDRERNTVAAGVGLLVWAGAHNFALGLAAWLALAALTFGWRDL